MLEQTSDIEVTAFKWMPAFARGFVRDFRVRWALEEVGLPYRVRLIGGPDDRPENYRADQPFNQVPVYKEGSLCLFESGAILMHIGEKDDRLLPRDADGRARAIAWLIAALNSIEPISAQLGAIDVFNPEAEWGKLRRPELVNQVAAKVAAVAEALGARDWLEGRFTIGDMMMIDALRGISDQTIVDAHPNLSAYVARGKARPAFARAMAAQLADFEAADAKMVAA